MVYVMVVANSLDSSSQKSQYDLYMEKLADIVADGFSKGETGPQIAKRLAKGDKNLAAKYRKRIRALIYRNPDHLKEAVARQMQGDMLAGLPGTMTAVVKRAHRGRMDAAKVMLEASGFHNPRVKHEHSGDIKVTLDMPRPKFEQDVVASIEDADVVE